MRAMRWLGSCLATLSVLCGGCGHNGAPAPATIGYANATAVYVMGVPITPNTPSGGGVTTYSVSPALPAGLTLNAGTGIVSGTPSSVTAKASYTVTATGPGGSTTTTLTITVNDQSPTQFSYAAGTATYIVNAPITENDPSSAGGIVTSYTVNPALPAGLSLSTTTGDITGTPITLTPLAKYTVTATNTGGTAISGPVYHRKSRVVRAAGSSGGPGLRARQCNIHGGRSDSGQCAQQHRRGSASIHRSKRESSPGLQRLAGASARDVN